VYCKGGQGPPRAVAPPKKKKKMPFVILLYFLISSTYFGHYYAHHQQLATMMFVTTSVVSFCKDGGDSFNVNLWFLVVCVRCDVVCHLVIAGDVFLLILIVLILYVW